MMKYSVLFVLAFLAGLVWMFSDAVIVTTAESPETVKVPIMEPQPLNQPVPLTNNSRVVAEQPAEHAISSAVEQTVATMQGMAEPFTADVPYLTPAQRRDGHLGGPPPRSMMLTNPQEVY